jgi:hypothetical protein
MNFHIGQQVVCVNVDPTSASDPVHLRLLHLRQVYTIRAIKTTGGLLLNEIVYPLKPSETAERDYHHWRFRPVKRTDISCFTAMLKKTPRRVRAAA